MLERRDDTLNIGGLLDKQTVPRLWGRFERMKSLESICAIDIGEVEAVDSAGVAFLDEVQSRIGEGVELRNIPAGVADTITIFTSRKLAETPPPPLPGFFENLGGRVIEWVGSVHFALALTSDIVFWSVVGLFRPGGQRKGAFAQQAGLIGVDALPIVGLLSFIIGLILALQSAAQLRQFGAGIFIADLIAISMVREMGPMMTAIIIAGRSGSAIASEIATMKVTEELDALRMMAINPIRYVVAPKFHAITVSMPILVIMSIFIGISGGLVIAITYLGLSWQSYVNECIHILTLKDIILSMSKSIAFSWVIVIIGSYYGFTVKGGAEGVGRATTMSVVAAIFAVIVVDVMFSFAYLG
ncbi:MAG: MlaE family lipid ABC transporter permease subunit [Candidatus Cloacimonetes bacterium]|nr:MlaE family lipid ABC transporter permease subunit [Candidatus Cloacimonadota bacterium]